MSEWPKVIEQARNDTGVTEKLLIAYGLIDVNKLDSSIMVDLRYADTNNFLHFPLYDKLEKAYFPCDVAIKLCNAQSFLKAESKDLSLMIFDAARPKHIQKTMWDSLKMNERSKYKYLASPDIVSLHNYGCAVDLSVFNSKTNELLDMGTSFDTFGKLSEPIHESANLRNGLLDSTQIQNRLLLRRVMHKAGFNGISSEWWHYNSCSKEYALNHYTLIP